MAKNGCRDCKKCTERGVFGFTKKVANAALIAGTLGTSVIGSKAVKSLRQTCPVCSHPLAQHSVIDGRFKD